MAHCAAVKGNPDIAIEIAIKAADLMLEGIRQEIRRIDMPTMRELVRE
jgi:hypothetical protein